MASTWPELHAGTVFGYVWDVSGLVWIKQVPIAIGAGGGDASAANQLLGNVSLASIDTKLTSQATAAKQDLLLVELQLKADLTETQPVSLASIPINAAAATSTLQTTGNSSLSSIDGKLTNPLPVSLPAATVITLTPPAAITGFATSANQVTELASLALAATAALQTSGNASLTTIAALSKAEDAASVDLDTGVPVLAVRSDTPQTLTSATGDYGFVTTDAQGRIWVNNDVLGELTKRSNDLLLTKARLVADQFRFQSMMSGAFVPVPEVW